MLTILAQAAETTVQDPKSGLGNVLFMALFVLAGIAVLVWWLRRG